MIRALYTIVLLAGLVVLAPVFLWRGIRHRKYLGSLGARLGRVDAGPSELRTLWVHAVSVGELLAAEALIRRLATDTPGWRVVVSTTTATGQQLAMERFPELAVFYFPLDLPWSARRAIRRIAPDVVCFVETEIWPNFLAECRRRNVRVAVVNGRLSDRSYRGYARARRLLAPFLQAIDRFLMQTEADATRIRQLGADAACVEVTGNLKYDVDGGAVERRVAALRPELEQAFGLPDSRPLVLAGSTAEGEEAMLADALVALRLREGLRETRLLVAPRRPERFGLVAQLFEERSLRCSRRTAPSDPAGADILLLDSIGELASAYALADVVFVGGSLVPHGGQNILEPAILGRPVVVGPYTSNFRQIVDDFLARDAVVQLDGESRAGGPSTRELADALATLLLDRHRATTIGRRGQDVVRANRGAVDRTIAALAPILERAS